MTETPEFNPSRDDDELDEEMLIGDPAEARMNVIIYILYFLSTSLAVTSIVGVVLAYLNRDDNDLDWVDSHFIWQIRTFWVGLLILVAGTILSPILIGIPLLIFGYIWWIVRAVRGLLWVIDGEAVPHPESWMFGSEIGEGPASRDEIIP